MEPSNLQKKIAKFWHMVRVALFMLKKGISSTTKLFSDLNLLLKRGKIAGKAIHNLMFHHHHHHIPTTTTTHHHHHEYEFSCSNTPSSHHFTTLFKRKNHHQIMLSMEDDEVMTPNTVMKALEMTESPAAFPWFGKSPVVEIIKGTPLQVNYGNEDSNHVDEAADEFIKRFYKNLRKQNSFAYPKP